MASLSSSEANKSVRNGTNIRLTATCDTGPSKARVPAEIMCLGTEVEGLSKS